MFTYNNNTMVIVKYYVAKAVGYHAPPCKGFRRVAQGNPLSPTIFNIVV